LVWSRGAGVRRAGLRGVLIGGVARAVRVAMPPNKPLNLTPAAPRGFLFSTVNLPPRQVTGVVRQERGVSMVVAD